MQYVPPLIDRCRRDISLLMQTLVEATNLPPTHVAKFSAFDPKFFRTYLTKNFTVGTYDLIVGRLSAVWPEAVVAWPYLVPRVRPAEVKPEEAEDFRLTLERALARREAARAKAAADEAKAKADEAARVLQEANARAKTKPTPIEETAAHG